MSITSLVNEELSRTRSLAELAHVKAQPSETKTSATFKALVRYIPTEVITLYIAAASAMEAIKATFASVNETNTYWFFVVLTPIIFLIVLVGQRKSKQLSALPRWGNWPWWKLFSATIAFAVWALAVPTTPYLSSPEGGVIAAFFATFVSVGLSLLAPIFEHP